MLSSFSVPFLFVCLFVCLFLSLRAIGLWQRSHQIQLLALLVRIDGRSLVVIDQLVQRMELALSNAIHVLLHVHAEVFVAAGRLQGNRVITHL